MNAWLVIDRDLLYLFDTVVPDFDVYIDSAGGGQTINAPPQSRVKFAKTHVVVTQK